MGVGECGRGTDQAADGGRRSECCEQASCAVDGCLESVDNAPNRNADVDRKVLSKDGEARPSGAQQPNGDLHRSGWSAGSPQHPSIALRVTGAPTSATSGQSYPDLD